ncbi:MAG TPA: lysylphosphatidylglycerol synthase transmembrane domain-containing protein [Candidatus Acidoferrales bacterium]|nr:lysylphosphatidylglycerol synthase transmembrane domain-containing protein [Candidatus Acidoferrales bacterium]
MGANTDTPPGRGWLSSIWLKLGLSVVLLAVLLKGTDLPQLAGAVRQAHPAWVIAALVGYILSMVVSSVRWTMLARPLGFDEPYSHFFASYFTGMYMNLFAPSTVAGDIGRALFLAGAQKRKALAFTTVIADRGLGFVVLSCIGALAILTQPGYHLPALLYYGAWIVPPGTLLGWLYLPKLMVRAFSPENHWRHLVERDLAPYWHDYRLLGRTSAVAVVFHTMQILTQVLLAWALDMKVPVSFFFIFVPVVNILGMLPITFSGIGLREIFYRSFLAQVGIDPDLAVALGLLSSVVVLATGISSGLVFLFWRSRLPAAVGPNVQPAANDTR